MRDSDRTFRRVRNLSATRASAPTSSARASEERRRPALPDSGTIVYVTSAGSLANNDTVKVFFARTGDLGATGATGATGPTILVFGGGSAGNNIANSRWLAIFDANL